LNGGLDSNYHASYSDTLSDAQQLNPECPGNSPLPVRVNRLPAMSTLSRGEVANLARLARIEMTDQELDDLSSEMDVILGAVARVQEVASADVKPTSHPLPLRNVTRPDVVVPGLSPDQALSGAPAKEGARFRVPKILGEEE